MAISPMLAIFTLVLPLSSHSWSKLHGRRRKDWADHRSLCCFLKADGFVVARIIAMAIDIYEKLIIDEVVEPAFLCHG